MQQRWKRALPALILIALVLLYSVWTGGTATGMPAPPNSGSALSSASGLSTPPEGGSSVSASDSASFPDAEYHADSAMAVQAIPDEHGSYTSRDDVALYLLAYGHLPDNFITKKQAEALGWQGGSLEPYAPGKSIGGSHFGNYEGALPEREGRRYTECDIDTQGADKRGAKRIVFSNDGLIYYTGDHYKTFTLLYGEE